MVTPVFLAFPDSRIHIKDKECTPWTTRLGGLPIGLDGVTKPPVKFSRCHECGRIMPLILQTNIPVENAMYDRVIYVWACCFRSCQYKEGTVRVVRGMRCRKKKEVTKLMENVPIHQEHGINLGNLVFNTCSHSSRPSDVLNPFQIKPSKEIKQETMSVLLGGELDEKDAQINLNSLQNQSQVGINEVWPPDHEILQYDVELLYIEKEKDQKVEEKESLNIKNFEDKFVKQSEYDEWSGETYEKSNLEKGFRMFVKKVKANPQQCVRYHRKGLPLYYSLADSLVKKIKLSETNYSLGTCRLCGSQNVFEFQIMPNTINILEKNKSLGDMLWGTIIVGTCSNDCMPDLNDKDIGYAEEWVGVQWEDMKKII